MAIEAQIAGGLQGIFRVVRTGEWGRKGQERRWRHTASKRLGMRNQMSLIRNTACEAPTKVIFLDVDGVLHSFDRAGALFCPPQMRLLKEIVMESGADIVLSSNWRLSREGIREVTRQLKQYGLHFTSQTIDLRSSGGTDGAIRAKEIYVWLKENPDVDTWLILDDLDLLRECKPQHREILNSGFVRTDRFRGLRRDRVEVSLKVLNTSGGTDATG